MQQHFQAISEVDPGEKWRGMFDRHWASYREWFLSEGDQTRANYLTSSNKLKQYMPELLPIYERICELAGGGDVASRFLSLYQPPPYLSSCSQAVWTGDQPYLIRNYDYSPKLLDGILMDTRWNLPVRRLASAHLP